MKNHSVNLRRNRKSNSQQNITYIVLLILLLIFFGTVGVQLIIKASLMISGVSKPESDDKADEQSYMSPPEIYAFPDATNSARLAISGRGTEKTDLIIYVNDEKVDTIALTSDDFATEISLKKGENTVYLESEDEKSKKIRSSDTYKILYLSGKPSLTIESPTPDQTFSTAETFVKGKTDTSVAIRINGSPAVVSVDGSFTYSARLKEGENEIIIEATDIAGNQESVTLKVKYEKDE